MLILRSFLLFVFIISVISCGVKGDDPEPEDNGSSLGTTTIEKSVEYDNAGRVIKIDLGDGKYIEYIYDENGNIVEISKN